MGQLANRIDGRRAHSIAAACARSSGVLSGHTLTDARLAGVPLAFDPVQGGWVPDDCKDDLLPSDGVADYVFRPWQASDAGVLARMLSSEAIWRYMPEDVTGTVDPGAAQALIEISNTTPHQIVRAIELSGAVIGQVRLVPDGAEAEISYWLDETHWGQGHGTEVVARFTKGSFDADRGLTRIFAKVHQDNAASARVLERCGYVENRGRQAGVWRVFETGRI